MDIRNRTRKAISPIIATVLIIAVTLIAAVAIGGYVFGIFGQSSSSAQVQVTNTALQASAFTAGSPVAATCGTTSANAYITLLNTGTSGVTVTVVTITYGGANNAFSISGSCTVGAAGSSTSTSYVLFGSTNHLSTGAVAGQQFTGTVTLSNGAQILFNGVFE